MIEDIFLSDYLSKWDWIWMEEAGELEREVEL